MNSRLLQRASVICKSVYPACFSSEIGQNFIHKDSFRVISYSTSLSKQAEVPEPQAQSQQSSSTDWHQDPVEDLEEIRARIFGNRIGNGERSGAKLLRQKLIGEKIASYYPENISRKDPFLVDTKGEA